jgi:hypothetical protein
MKYIMAQQITLRPSDVVVACQLALSPAAQFVPLAYSTGLSVGECHNAVRRLRIARLLLPDDRRPPTELLHQFLVHGATFAFPAMLGAPAVGVPTGISSPAFRAIAESSEGFVWPDADGTVRGQSVVPLFPAATNLPGRNPSLYDLLTIVDAIRIGSARIRKIAADLLTDRLSNSAK